MLIIKQKKNVINNKVIIDVPENFGSEVEVIILSKSGNPNSKDTGTIYSEDINWENLTIKEFIEGYGESDSIYDNYQK